MGKYDPKRYRAKKEKAELEKSYHGIYTAPKRRRSKKQETARRRKTIMGICIFVIIVAIAALVAALFIMEKEGQQTILPNVTVAGIDVGGLTQEEAITKVTNATKSTYSSIPMTVTVLDSTVEISPDAVGNFDVEAAVKDAFAFGNRGTKSERDKAKEIAKKSGYVVDITAYLDLDSDAIRAELNKLGELYNSTLSQSTYEVVGETPSQEQLASGSNMPTLVIHLGVAEYGLNVNTLYDQVIAAYNNNKFSVVGECSMLDPDPIDLDAIYEKYCADAVDASQDPETKRITGGQFGYGFDKENAAVILENAQNGTTVEIAFIPIAPKVTAQDLLDNMFKDELAVYEAHEDSDIDRAANLKVACEAIDGVILYPGDKFSYNDTLGPRTEERGFRPGPSYAGGTVTTTIGGGICQVSSVLYYCTVLADLEIIARDCHGFMPHYMEPGTDAMVSWGTYDFKFKNNSNHPVRIEATADGGTVKVRLMGTDDKDYYVKFISEILETRPASVTNQVMDANNAPGYKHGDYIIPPHDGYTTKSYRCKYNKETNELLSMELEADSYYRVLDGVKCVIQSETNPGGMSDSGELPPE